MNEDLKRRVMENLSKPIGRVPFDKDALNAANKKALDGMVGNLRQTVSNIRFVKKKSIFQIWADKIKRWF